MKSDLIVAEYFAMLTEELAGRSYNKAARNRTLQAKIGRSRPSIEYKHQNISAVLKGFGQSWITGYKPASNFQTALIDAVWRWLDQNPAWPPPPGLRETTPLWIGPPPTFSNQPPPEDLEKTLAIARKYDAAGRDERNRTLGRLGEERVLAHERAVLTGAGRRDLANRVRWVSEEDGDGAGYDIASFDADGHARLIEVKTTNGWERTPFYITRNELETSRERPDEWRLLRLWNFAREPKAYELSPPLDRHVKLIAESYHASFQ